MVPAAAAQTYARVALETGVAAASPPTLVVMLYDGALRAIADAKSCLLAGELGPKGRALGKAIAIVGSGLRASLDTSRGGSIAQQLADLYEYVERRLLEANLRNDARLLDEVTALLKDLREAWAQLAAQGPVSRATGR